MDPFQEIFRDQLQKRKQRFDVWNDLINELNSEKQNSDRKGFQTGSN